MHPRHKRSAPDELVVLASAEVALQAVLDRAAQCDFFFPAGLVCPCDHAAAIYCDTCGEPVAGVVFDGESVCHHARTLMSALDVMWWPPR